MSSQSVSDSQNILHSEGKVFKKSWTEEEDRKLLRLVDLFGTSGSWSVIASQFGSRSGKQCRERYHNHLRPDIKKNKWTIQEDRFIAEKQSTLGNQWSKIAKFLPGRTDSAVKNRWHIMQRSRYYPLHLNTYETVDKGSDSMSVPLSTQLPNEAELNGRFQESNLQSQTKKRRSTRDCLFTSPSVIDATPEPTTIDLMAAYHAHDSHSHVLSPKSMEDWLCKIQPQKKMKPFAADISQPYYSYSDRATDQAVHHRDQNDVSCNQIQSRFERSECIDEWIETFFSKDEQHNARTQVANHGTLFDRNNDGSSVCSLPITSEGSSGATSDNYCDTDTSGSTAAPFATAFTIPSTFDHKF